MFMSSTSSCSVICLQQTQVYWHGTSVRLFVRHKYRVWIENANRSCAYQTTKANNARYCTAHVLKIVIYFLVIWTKCDTLLCTFEREYIRAYILAYPSIQTLSIFRWKVTLVQFSPSKGYCVQLSHLAWALRLPLAGVRCNGQSKDRSAAQSPYLDRQSR